MTLRILDLCCGFGGASHAMKDRGWQVVDVDTERWLNPTIVASVRDSPIRPTAPFDVVWASPPCTQYALKYVRHQADADIAGALALVQNCKRIIDELQPRWWVLENTRSGGREIPAVLGPPVMHIGSWVFWGRFPLVMLPQGLKKNTKKDRVHPARPWFRSIVPYPISLAFAEAFESYREA